MSLIIGIIIVLLLNSFFAGIEIGMISLLRPRIHHEAAKGSSAACLVEKIINKPSLMLATTLFGNNVCTVLVSVMGDQLFVAWGFAGTASLIYSTAVMTVLLMLSEIIPKNWFRQSPEERCMFFIPFYYLLGWILYPGAKIMAYFTELTLKVFSGEQADEQKTRNLLRQDLRMLLRDSENAGSIDEGAADLLDKAIDFNSQRIQHIYIPLEKLVTITPDATLTEAIAACRVSGKSRLPVINGNKWEGIFSLYDAIFNISDDKWDNRKVSGCLRTTTSVSLNDPITEVLKKSKEVNTRMILVNNKNGEYVGAVTTTDVSRVLFNH